MNPVKATYKFKTVRWDSDGPLVRLDPSNLYVWWLFWKLDGDTLFLDGATDEEKDEVPAKILGIYGDRMHAVPYPTTVSNGGATNIGNLWPIKPNFGDPPYPFPVSWSSTVKPIEPAGGKGGNVDAAFGLIAVLFGHGSLTEDTISDGHRWFDKAVSDGLSSLVEGLGLFGPPIGSKYSPSNQDIAKLKEYVSDTAYKALEVKVVQDTILGVLAPFLGPYLGIAEYQWHDVNIGYLFDYHLLSEFQGGTQKYYHSDFDVPISNAGQPPLGGWSIQFSLNVENDFATPWKFEPPNPHPGIETGNPAPKVAVPDTAGDVARPIPITNPPPTGTARYRSRKVQLSPPSFVSPGALPLPQPPDFWPTAKEPGGQTVGVPAAPIAWPNAGTEAEPTLMEGDMVPSPPEFAGLPLDK